MQAEETKVPVAEDATLHDPWEEERRLREAEAARLAGIRERVKSGVAGMVADLSQKGINPMIGATLGMLTGVLNTWLDHASDNDVDLMLSKIVGIVADWRTGEGDQHLS